MKCDIKRNAPTIRAAIYKLSMPVALGGIVAVIASAIYIHIIDDWNLWLVLYLNMFLGSAIVRSCWQLIICLLSSPQERRKASVALLWNVFYFISVIIVWCIIYHPVEMVNPDYQPSINSFLREKG